MATWDLRDAVNASAQQLPPEVDEFELAGLRKAPSRLVKPMRVARSPIQFECVDLRSLRFPGNGPMGRVDVVKIRPIARTPSGSAPGCCPARPGSSS
jgi:flavin reductase (DIM6/NTAB) family NADH-FMN oxidoreductase RutF